jgi:hypothetical protein
MTQPTLPSTRPAAADRLGGGTPPGATTGTTRWLLACGAVAGPLYIAASLVQALARPGFSITRQEASVLTLGSTGWIQVANFLVAGALFLAGAAGCRRALRGGPGRTWVPLLMAATGAGIAAGGIFKVDPNSGYPPGTPAGASATADWHGILHTVCGGIAFLALVALCFVLARQAAASGHRTYAVFSRIAGVLCAVGIASGGAPHGSLTIFIGVGIAMFWVALTSARLITGQATAAGSTAPAHQPAPGHNS